MAISDDEFEAELARRGLAAKPVAPPTPQVARVATGPNPSPQPSPVPVSKPNAVAPVIGAVPPVVLPRPAQTQRPVVLGAVPSVPTPLLADTQPIEYSTDDPPWTGCPHCGEQSCPHTRPDCDFDASCDARLASSFRGQNYCAGHARIVWRALAVEAREEWIAESTRFVANDEGESA